MSSEEEILRLSINTSVIKLPRPFGIKSLGFVSFNVKNIPTATCFTIFDLPERCQHNSFTPFRLQAGDGLFAVIMTALAFMFNDKPCVPTSALAFCLDDIGETQFRILRHQQGVCLKEAPAPRLG
ncbi:hypothetical protein CEXT_304301 [Caerostris extrusa]|uniref:Uncharacterized protein n=1 Tax=Caerostris extrusa TaxID=172846 RepID=A0AAV4SG17_CAEEX|nr:hypothetical protein CEXT_304301 [Caerostris extrusa]